MAKAFPNHWRLTGNFAPIRTECDAFDLVVRGEIPKVPHGSLYRIGPDPQFAPRDRHHRFAGDGVVHAFRIDDGKVSYRNRWVRTPKWQLEPDALHTLGSHRFDSALRNNMTAYPQLDPRTGEQFFLD